MSLDPIDPVAVDTVALPVEEEPTERSVLSDDGPAADAPAAEDDGPDLVIRHHSAVAVLEVPPDLDFAALRSWLRSRMPAHAETLEGRSARLDLGPRPLALFDLRRLVNLLRDEFSVEVTALVVDQSEVWEYAERELKLKLIAHKDGTDTGSAHGAPALGPDDDTEHADRDAAPVIQEARRLPAPRLDPVPDEDPLDELLGRADGGPGTRTLSVHRTLRSGAALRFDGDVTVFGDVNPGAQIIAAGNIMVLGAMKGLAHAGASGDESAIILGLDLRPTQLRIARKIAIAPRTDRVGGLNPTVARIQDGQIVIEPYRTRGTR